MNKGKTESSCQDINVMANADKEIFLINKITTGDETGVSLVTPTQSDSSEWVGEAAPQPKKQILRVLLKEHVDHFFNSQGVVQKEFVP
jgi:hypothetical protein